MKLTVNGTARTVLAAPDTPLLYVLRDELQLQGPRFGCGLGQFGACTVHLAWTSYPILRMPEVPDRVEVVLLNRPDLPSYGAGEPACVATAPAIANAIFDATEARVRTAPFTPDRVAAALRQRPG